MRSTVLVAVALFSSSLPVAAQGKADCEAAATAFARDVAASRTKGWPERLQKRPVVAIATPRVAEGTRFDPALLILGSLTHERTQSGTTYTLTLQLVDKKTNLPVASSTTEIQRPKR